MITLTKKYRIVWQWYTLNIINEYESEWSGVTMITNPTGLGTFESDVWQDILDKIDEIGLRPPDNWYIPGKME